MGDAAGTVHGLNLEPVFEPLQPVPEPLPAAQHDRHHDDVQVVNQAGGQEFADGGRAAADADIGASGGLARLRKRLGGNLDRQSDCRYRARTAVRLAARANKPWLV